MLFKQRNIVHENANLTRFEPITDEQELFATVFKWGAGDTVSSSVGRPPRPVRGGCWYTAAGRS